MKNIREFNKLIRDKIPDIIRSRGEEVEVRTLTTSELLPALMQKLQEETAELNKTPNLEELADVQEVLDELIKVVGHTKTEVVARQRSKRAERGGFHKRLWLIRTFVK